MKVVSQENRVGKCIICKNEVRDMMLMRGEDKRYFYACLDCLGRGNSRKVPSVYSVEAVDEERLAREKALGILITLAEEDEDKFNDMRLSVVKSFESEIAKGELSSRLESYLNFNGNNLTEVLKVRAYALNALSNSDLPKNKELIELYKKSRIEKWSFVEQNRLKLLLSDWDVQILDDINKDVLNSMDQMLVEVSKDASRKRYDNLEDVKKILTFYEDKLYLTESQLKRLKGFYNEMSRRNNRITKKL